MKGLSVTIPPRSEWLPIGSIYISVNTVNPGTIFGGIWEQIKDKFMLCSGDTYSNGSSGGQASVTLSTENIPAHTHTRGTMNITGELNYNNSYSGGNVSSAGMIGAFYPKSQPSNDYYLGSRSSGSGWGYIGFDASRTWTGETSSIGNGEAFSNMPPYLAVTVWKRVA